jgi:hypothetical protein
MSSSPPDDTAHDPEAARVLSRVRRLMAISLLLTGLAVAAVLVLAGLRIATREAVAPPADASLPLPQGGRVVSTAVAGDRVVVTIEAAGATEVHLFDVRTLEPRGRLRIGPQ